MKGLHKVALCLGLLLSQLGWISAAEAGETLACRAAKCSTWRGFSTCEDAAKEADHDVLDNDPNCIRRFFEKECKGRRACRDLSKEAVNECRKIAEHLDRAGELPSCLNKKSHRSESRDNQGDYQDNQGDNQDNQDYDDNV
jgi:hypothetical protein